ncbi:MAG: hypothetical protein ACE37D_05755 [Pseudomonadales bacterium]
MKSDHLINAAFLLAFVSGVTYAYLAYTTAPEIAELETFGSSNVVLSCDANWLSERQQITVLTPAGERHFQVHGCSEVSETQTVRAALYNDQLWELQIDEQLKVRYERTRIAPWLHSAFFFYWLVPIYLFVLLFTRPVDERSSAILAVTSVGTGFGIIVTLLVLLGYSPASGLFATSAGVVSTLALIWLLKRPGQPAGNSA